MTNAFADTYLDITQKAPKGSVLNPRGLQLIQDTSEHPSPVSHPSVTRIELPYLDFSVNVWLYRTPQYSLIIDTGGPNSSFLTSLEPLTSPPLHYLITHSHPDHIGGLRALKKAYPLSSSFLDTDFVTLSTPGHCKEHFSYYNPSEGICFCGDALFAGSMGKANFSYSASIASLHLLLNLPPETLLFPGHGPATCVKWEQNFNCFYTP